MYTVNIDRAINRMTVNQLRVFISENYHKQIGFLKESSYHSMKYLKNTDLLLLANKLVEKMFDPTNVKRYY